LQDFVEAHLITVEELSPYIKYWIDLCAGEMPGHHSDDVFVLLRHYINFYEFTGAAALIAAFGYQQKPPQAVVDRAIEVALKNRPSAQ
jgi:hypothetical protein